MNASEDVQSDFDNTIIVQSVEVAAAVYKGDSGSPVYWWDYNGTGGDPTVTFDGIVWAGTGTLVGTGDGRHYTHFLYSNLYNVRQEMTPWYYIYTH